MKYLVVLLVALFSLNFGSTNSGQADPVSQVKTINLVEELNNQTKSKHLVQVILKCLNKWKTNVIKFGYCFKPIQPLNVPKK